MNNWSGAKASNQFGGSLALGGDFDGATIGLKVSYDIQQRHGYFESDRPDRIVTRIARSWLMGPRKNLMWSF